MHSRFILLAAFVAGLAGAPATRGAAAVTPPPRTTVAVTGSVVDDASGQPVPARIYVQGSDGRWYFPTSGSPAGVALRHEKRHGGGTNSVEMHTILSAHPFRVNLPPGDYTVTVERGKEYHPLIRSVRVGATPPEALDLRLQRWINLASRGWYSGDTHVHRAPEELGPVMLAEDVNVTHPMVFWTTEDRVPPARSPRSLRGDFPAGGRMVDATHVIGMRNAEYEIFNTAGRNHTLGALVILNHQSPPDLPALPVSAVAAWAHREGALLDLEKHNWDWSMALVPVVQPDLFELANNHLWQTGYGVRGWAIPAPAWMGVGRGTDTEQDWVNYGLLNYYALLDCGFRLRPTAATGHGVHPVPLGFGRVYVHLPGGFTFADWMRRLNEGRSFVTTGPMLLATIHDEVPGGRFELAPGRDHTVVVAGTIHSEQPVRELEVVANGTVARRIALSPKPTGAAWESAFREEVPVRATTWVALRCREARGGRERFAHTAPTWFDVAGEPLRPRREEIDFLLERVRAEMRRSVPMLPPAAVADYEKALAAYEAIARTAR